MVSSVERIMARRQVDAEIKSDTITVSMTRRPKVDDGAGGWTWGTPVTGDPIECLITTAKRRLSDMLQNTELGDVVRAPYILIAPHNADILRGDEFTYNGDRFEIVGVQIKTDIETIAQVDYLAGTHNA